MGHEMLAENAAITGRWPESLAYVAAERAIAVRIHSRERQAWTHLPAGLSECALDHSARAEAEFDDGIALARSLGERRLATYLEACRPFAVADRGRLDDALRMATEALAAADELGLLFIRTEARRALAYVHYVRREWDESIRVHDEVLVMLDGREPAVTRLLMGPCHVQALEAAGRLDEARARLSAFEHLAACCQSPHAVSEAARLRAESH